MAWKCRPSAICTPLRMPSCSTMPTIAMSSTSTPSWRISGTHEMPSVRLYEPLSAPSSRNQVYNNTGMNILSMLGFEKITAPFPAVEMNLFRSNRALGELNAQLFDRFVGRSPCVRVNASRFLSRLGRAPWLKWATRGNSTCSTPSTIGTVDMRCAPVQEFCKSLVERLGSIRCPSVSSEPNRMEQRPVNASSNFWGRIGDSDDIGARIYDKFDNRSLNEVNFYPPYLDSARLRQGMHLTGRTTPSHCISLRRQMRSRLDPGRYIVLHLLRCHHHLPSRAGDVLECRCANHPARHAHQSSRHSPFVGAHIAVPGYQQ